MNKQIWRCKDCKRLLFNFDNPRIDYKKGGCRHYNISMTGEYESVIINVVKYGTNTSKM